MGTIRWIPQKDADKYMGASILHIEACAHEMIPLYGDGRPENPMTNHWTICCVISPGEFISLDPNPAAPNNGLVLVVNHQIISMSRQRNKVVQLGTMDLTIRSLLELLHDEKYDKYHFDSRGVGCRYWVSSVLTLLAKRGFVKNADELANFLTKIQVVWNDQGEPATEVKQSGLDRGKFFEIESS